MGTAGGSLGAIVRVAVGGHDGSGADRHCRLGRGHERQLIAVAYQGSFFGIIPEPEFELVVTKLFEDHGLEPAGFGFPVLTSTTSPASISAQQVGGPFGCGWLLALAGGWGPAVAGTSPLAGSALVGFSASSLSNSALLTNGTVARPAARMAPTGNCLARSTWSAVSTLSVCKFRLVAAFKARAVWSATNVAASGRPCPSRPNSTIAGAAGWDVVLVMIVLPESRRARGPFGLNGITCLMKRIMK